MTRLSTKQYFLSLFCSCFQPNILAHRHLHENSENDDSSIGSTVVRMPNAIHGGAAMRGESMDMMDSEEERLRFEEREIREMEDLDYEYRDGELGSGRKNRRNLTIAAPAQEASQKKQNTSPRVKLREARELSKAEYQQKWQSYNETTNTSFSLNLQNKQLQLEELEGILTRNNIFPLASGAMESTFRIYSYAENQDNQWFLLEMQFNRDDSTLQLKLKTLTTEPIGDFLRHFENILKQI